MAYGAPFHIPSGRTPCPASIPGAHWPSAGDAPSNPKLFLDDDLLFFGRRFISIFALDNVALFKGATLRLEHEESLKPRL
jgi:hypothetical protein